MLESSDGAGDGFVVCGDIVVATIFETVVVSGIAVGV